MLMVDTFSNRIGPNLIIGYNLCCEW
jgi:hypothetical protein